MFVVLDSVPKILVDAIAFDKPPLKPVPVGALHVYVVPAGTTPFVASVGVTVNITPLQVTVVIGVTVAFGFTVTVTVNAAPVQAPVVGVTVYTAVLAELTGLTRLPLILTALVPVVPPVITPADGALHV
jgi:hypothetical protein